MALKVTLEIVDQSAHITLVGELDAASAPLFRAEIEAAAQAQVNRLVLFMQKLDFMASAGLRVLAFARQKMGGEVDIYMVGVQESVLETITMTGFHHSVFLVDSYDASQIESA